MPLKSAHRMVFVSQDRIQPPAAHPLPTCPSATGKPGDFPPSPPKDILGETPMGTWRCWASALHGHQLGERKQLEALALHPPLCASQKHAW